MNKLAKKIIFLLMFCFILNIASANEVKFERIGGSDRYNTAIEISKKSITKSEKAYLVSGENFPDAVSVSPLAMQENAPVLLVKANSIPDGVMEELERIKAKEIVLIGKEKAISKELETEFLKNFKVTRIGGKDRYETSKEVFEYKKSLYPSSTKVAFVTGRDFPDALCAAPYIYQTGSIILYDEGEITSSYKPDIIFGGPSAIKGFEGIERIWGKDRYETSLKIAEKIGNKTFIVANGENFPDALTACSLTRKYNSPMILVSNNLDTKNYESYIKKNKIEDLIVIGKEAAVSQETANKLEQIINKIEDPQDNHTTKPVNLDKSGLVKQIEEARKINLDDLKDKSILEEAILSAEKSLKDSKKQEELDKSKEDLKNILSKLEYKEYVEIEDPLLRKVINKNLSLERKDDDKITKEEIESLEDLSWILDKDGKATFNINEENVNMDGYITILSDKESLMGHPTDFKFKVTRHLKSLKGLEKAKNLKKIKLNENEIEDISPLKDLVNLEYVELQANRIKDIKPLENLNKIWYLKLYNNLIEDISPIAKLTEITDLDLHYNVKVTGDESNKTYHDGITSIDALKGLKKLKMLDISSNRIEDVQLIKTFDNLENLDFSDNLVTNYEGLSDLIIKLLGNVNEEDGEPKVNFMGQRAVNTENLEVTGESLIIKNPYKGMNKLIRDIATSTESEVQDINFFKNIEYKITYKNSEGKTITEDKGVRGSLDLEKDELVINFTADFFNEFSGKNISIPLSLNNGEYGNGLLLKNVKVDEDLVPDSKKTFYKSIFNKKSPDKKTFENLTDEANEALKGKSLAKVDNKFTIKDMKMLKNFHLFNKDIDNDMVRPLKYAINLEEFYYDSYDAKYSRAVTDFSFLNSTPKLKTFQYLKNHSGKEYKDILQDHVDNIDFSNNKDLKDIRIMCTDLRNVFSMRGLDLNTLTLQNNKIGNIFVVKGMKNLERLDLDSNEIKDISKALENKTKLKTLYLRDNPIENIDIIGSLKGLEALHLRNTKIKNIDALNNLPELRRLYIDENNLNEGYFDVIKTLKNLNQLATDKISLEDYNYLKEQIIKNKSKATFSEDDAKMLTFKELEIKEEVERTAIKDETLTIANPIKDWDGNSVQEDNYEIDNPNIETKDDKIIISNIASDIKEIKEKYQIYFDNSATIPDNNEFADVKGSIVLNITIKDKQEETEDSSILPEKFSLRDKGALGEARNQYYDGSCRSFAAMAALESHVKMVDGLDRNYSENNLENRHGYNYSYSDGPFEVRKGRNKFSDLGYLLSNKGPIFEKDDPYVPMKHDFKPADYLSEEAKTQITKEIENYKSKETVINESKSPKILSPDRYVTGMMFLRDVDKNNIDSPKSQELEQYKKAIIAHGAVASNIYMKLGAGTFPYSNEETYNYEKFAYYSDDKEVANHAVAIVGWDDTFSRSNFKNDPGIDGAWIVRDAQTKYFGDQGLFYVSYKSTAIATEGYVFTETKDKTAFDGMLAHDEMPFTAFRRNSFFDSPEGRISVLFNRFEKDKAIYIDSIGYFTTKPNAEVELYLIEDFNAFERELDESDMDDVFEEYNKHLIKKFTQENSGYHLYKLEKPIEIPANKAFAIGLGVKNPNPADEEYDIVMEKKDTGLGKNAVVGKNETYAYVFGEFVDINKMKGQELGNIALRAYYKYK